MEPTTELLRGLPVEVFATIADRLTPSALHTWLSEHRTESGRIPDDVVVRIVDRLDARDLGLVAQAPWLSPDQQLLVAARGSLRAAEVLAKRDDLTTETAGELLKLGELRLTRQLWPRLDLTTRAQVLAGHPVGRMRGPLQTCQTLYNLADSESVTAAVELGPRDATHRHGLLRVADRLPARMQRDLVAHAVAAGDSAVPGNLARGVRGDLWTVLRRCGRELPSWSAKVDPEVRATVAAAVRALPDDAPVHAPLDVWIAGCGGELDPDVYRAPLPDLPPSGAVSARVTALLDRHPDIAPPGWVAVWASLTTPGAAVPAAVRRADADVVAAAVAGEAEVLGRLLAHQLVDVDTVARHARPARVAVLAAGAHQSEAATLWAQAPAEFAGLAVELLGEWDGTFTELATMLTQLDRPSTA